VKTTGAAVNYTKHGHFEDFRRQILNDVHVHRDDVFKVWKECREESFWYRGK
uniref:Uncharacterized protein n=1 Tax=Gouania willdenowi TaxID=441366 RepID=A0A8C5H696_GOUWI